MILFALLPVLLAGVVFLVALPFIRKPTTQQNRFRHESDTRTPFGAVVSGIKRTFNFRGRANRLDFGIFAIFAALVSVPTLIMPIGTLSVEYTIPAGGAGQSQISAAPNMIGPLIVMAITMVILLWLAVASLSIAVRRLHDINRSGWWLLLLPIFGVFVLFYWFAQPPSKDNQASVF